MKDKTFSVTLAHKDFVSLRKLCFMAGCSVPTFVRALLLKFCSNPEIFISSLDHNNNGTDVPGADDLSE